MKYQYYLSDHAYDTLYSMAVRSRFCGANRARRMGLGHFLTLLASKTFADTRPPEIRAADEGRIENAKIPYWKDDATRRARMLDISDSAIQQYCRIAQEHGMWRGPGWTTMIQWQSPRAIAGSVMEAIGLTWLTPNELPVNPVPSRWIASSTRRQRREIEW